MTAALRKPLTPPQTTPDTSGLGLDALMQVALRTRPDAAMLREPARKAAWSGVSEREWSAADIDRQATRLAALMALARLPEGSAAVILAPLGAELIVSLLAALRSGLQPVLPPLNASQADLQADLDAGGPAVALAVTRCGDLEPARMLRDACARSFNARLVAAFGVDVPDGVAPLDAVLASETPLGEALLRQAAAQTRPPALSVRDARGRASRFDEEAVVTAAVELGRHVRLGATSRILSLLIGADLATLASGPYLAAVTGAELLPLGHFQLSALWAALADETPTCLVAPAAVEDALRDAGVIGHPSVGSVVLVHHPAAEGRPDPAPEHGVIDIITDSEGGVMIAPRG
jgi:hypothetical protein